ncbi:NOD2 [Symbiodinium sp. CCMP2592]|nr:NOD2 [Symbiodinium sp. CCMP2592]
MEPNGTNGTDGMAGAILERVDERTTFWVLTMLATYVGTLVLGTLILSYGPKACQAFRMKWKKRPEALLRSGDVPATLHGQPQDAPDGLGTEDIDTRVPPIGTDAESGKSPGNKLNQKRAVQAAFLATCAACMAATALSMANGHLSKDTGLSWEGYATLCGLACMWQLAQACMAAWQLPERRQYGVTAFTEGTVTGMLPFLSDSFDTLKDSLFGGLCLQSQSGLTQALGVVAWLYLIAFHLVLLRRARFLAELGKNYLAIFLAPTQAKKPQSGASTQTDGTQDAQQRPSSCASCVQKAKNILLPMAYAQVAPTKQWLLVIENAPQALMAITYLHLEGGGLLVAMLNLAIPLVQVLGSFVLRPILRPMVAPWYATQLDAAAADSNLLLMKRLFLEADFHNDRGFFVLVTKQSDLLSVFCKMFPDSPDLAASMTRPDHNLKSYILALSINRLALRDHLDGSVSEEQLRLFMQKFPWLSGVALMDLKSGGRELAGVLGLCTDLRFLSLKGIALTREGAEAIVKAVADMPLESLVLRSNKIANIEALAAAVKRMTSLKRLDLSDNPLEPGGAKALAEGLRGHRALVFLCLCDIPCGDAFAEALELSTMRVLRSLRLAGSKLTDEGAKALAQHCKGHGALLFFWLERNEIGDVGAQALAETVPTMTALRGMELNDNKIWADGQEALRAAERAHRGRRLRRRRLQILMGGQEKSTE